MTIVVFTAFLRSTRGTAGTNQWFNTCSSQQWYDATSDGLCLNASKVVSVLDMDDSTGVTLLLGKYYFIVIHFYGWRIVLCLIALQYRESGMRKCLFEEQIVIG